ncbi:MAG TPA: S1/P1 nuclease [Pirellulales bacterium]|nr:S1/P1 nuclease [Pirellulales bacterium]
MKLARIALLLFMVCACAAPASGWNSTGHMAVALLAWKRLDPAQRQAAHRLLAAHPHYARYLTQQRPDDVPIDEWAFLRAATWPDWVRESREHHERDLAAYHHANWHYINLPFVAPEQAREFAAADLRPEAPNVITALNEAWESLNSGEGGPQEQAIHFCWVLHLVGDIHQPLHCASLVSRRFPPPKGDEGGNLVAINPHKRAEPLHTFWDHLLGTNTHARALEELAKRIEAGAESDRDLAARFRSHETVQSWADESYQAAVEFAYLNGRLPIVDYRLVERKEVDVHEVPVLPAGYAATARDVAHRQAALGGRRLAAVVQQILKR